MIVYIVAKCNYIITQLYKDIYSMYIYVYMYRYVYIVYPTLFTNIQYTSVRRYVLYSKSAIYTKKQTNKKTA